MLLVTSVLNCGGPQRTVIGKARAESARARLRVQAVLAALDRAIGEPCQPSSSASAAREESRLGSAVRSSSPRYHQ